MVVLSETGCVCQNPKMTFVSNTLGNGDLCRLDAFEPLDPFEPLWDQFWSRLNLTRASLPEVTGWHGREPSSLGGF